MRFAKILTIVIAAIVLLQFPALHAKPQVKYLSEMLPENYDTGAILRSWGVRECNLGGREFAKSISFGDSETEEDDTHVIIPTQGYDYFMATVGVAGFKPQGEYRVVFAVRSADAESQQRLFSTKALGPEDGPVRLHVDLKGARKIKLSVSLKGVPGRFLCWGDASLSKGKRAVIDPPGSGDRDGPVVDPPIGDDSPPTGDPRCYALGRAPSRNWRQS
jgi:hypothetical protein